MALLVRISILTSLVFLGTVRLMSQALSDTSYYRITWIPSRTLVIKGQEKKVISFYNAIHHRNNKELPLYSHSLNGRHILTASLLEDTWEETDASLTGLDISSIPTETQINVTNDWVNRVPYSLLTFFPLRRSAATGKVEKLVKFKLQLVEKTESSSPPTSQMRLAANGSVLAQGEWYKMAFPNTGVYKIDYNFLMSMGVNPDSIDYNRIQIWGNGGTMLPELCSAPRPIDLTENPILLVGTEDGKFDYQDYILIFVQGPNGWTKNVDEAYYRPLNHLYSAYAYYFLTVGSAAGKRVQKKSLSTAVPSATFTTYSCRYAYEKDNTNFLSSGKMWFGEAFDDNPSQTFLVPSTGIEAGTKINFVSSLLNKSTSQYPSTFRASLNGQLVNSYSMAGSGIPNHSPIGYTSTYSESLTSDSWANATSLNVNYSYTKSADGLGSGYLDYFALNFEENLTFKSNFIDFRKINSADYATVAYTISKSTASELIIWDVSDLGNIQAENLSTTPTSSTFVAETNESIKEYIAFSGSSFPSPTSFSVVPNQSISSTSTPNLLIITHPLFRAQAEELANFRRSFDKLDVVVASTDEVYNEFSSGAQDLIAIRDCARMYYKRPDGANFKYLLLFGDASFDYRNLLNYATASSYVPIFESLESMHPIYSYSSDDYVGMLADNKGDWENGVFYTMDIGVGRIPSNTPADAENVLNKLIGYASNTKGLSNWRNNVAYVVDNIDAIGEEQFLKYAEKVANQVEQTAKQYNVKKIYVGAYAKEVSPSGASAPGVNSDIISSLNNEGSLFMNYIGHGGIDQWASENIMNMSLVRSLTNIDKLCFFVTATCNYGQYDIPSNVSGGEEMLIQPKGGAIGLLTTTRAVYQGTNEILNSAFHDYVFARNPDGSHLRLGDVIQKSKNASAGGVELTRNFALLGDPSAMLAYGKDTIVITKINEKDYVSANDTLKAKSKVTISGEIRDFSGQKLPSFNGVVNILIYDKKTNTQTVDYTPNLAPLPFSVLDSKIFDGSATVKNGEFTFSLIIPRNINYNVGFGKFSLYAHSEDGSMTDASCGEPIYVGSSDTNTIVDNTPPVIKIYMNDETFVPGGFTNSNPVLLVKLSDEQGISGVGGLGRSIMGSLINNSLQSDIVLDSYYKTDRDTYKSGTIRYQLSNLKEGPNTIRIKAFDTDTNSATGSIDFVVAATETLSLDHILNYPNPFTTNTAFHFDHNRPGDNLDVMIQVFTVAGKLVKTMMTSSISAQTHFSDLHWDGKDDYGDEIGRGVYVYKLSVRALSDGSKTERFEKLVILN